MTNHLFSFLHCWFLDTRGATAIEYGLIAAGIAVVISGVVFAFGANLGEMIGNSADMVAERP